MAIVAAILPGEVSTAAGKSCGTGIAFADVGNDAAAVKAQTCSPDTSSGDTVISNADDKVDPNEYRLVLACDPTRLSDIPGGERTNCSYALTACQYRIPPSGDLLYRLESKPRGSTGAWTAVREMCGLDNAPPGAAPPPPVPTLGQIQSAFRALPFSKPTVRVEPKGNVTLVNLPTYYEAVWPGDAGLEPGEVSKPVQLLSWSVEFKIASRSYNFHYGDRTSSGPVTDAGGGHPEGNIRHTFTQPNGAARVSVDAQLTGLFRVNGGAWTDIDTIADLQNEPVTTLQVREAKARLYEN
jgi:hypothetical protein